jgi:hypothetical protein
MKNLSTYFLVLLFIISMDGIISGQNNPINFESGGFGANWTWAVFENADNPPLEIISNPDPSGINTSATVAKFTARLTGQPYAGCESQHGSDIGTFTLNSSNCIVKIMVWKSVISDVGIKFALPSGAALPPIKVANTLINQWEELTFDFSARIGDPNTIGQDQIIIFPDYAARTQENIIYFDNIIFSSISDVKELPNSFPSDFVLEQNYPNPFNPATNIRFSLPEANQVTLRVYDLLGQEVATLANQFMNAGTFEISFDASDLPTGIYTYSLTAGKFQSVKKMIYLK